MKYKIFITAFIVITVLIISTAFKTIVFKKNAFNYLNKSFSDTTKKKQTKVGKNNTDNIFEYPDDMTADTAKKRFLKEFNKGKILYNLTCAKCHNINVDEKQVIPDFSLPQLMDYEIRIQYQAHEDDLKETNVTHDELEFIVLYLRYKKKSGTPYKYLLSTN